MPVKACMPVINTSCCLLGRSHGLWSFLRVSRKELCMPCQREDVCEPSGLPVPFSVVALPCWGVHHCQGIAFGLFDVSASGKRGTVSQEKKIQDFKLNLALLVITCETSYYLFKGRMKKRWEKGWAVTQCSKRNKFRLCVTRATLGLICLVQEKYSVRSSSPMNMNGLSSLRIHLQTTYTHIILFAFTLQAPAGPETSQEPFF